MFKLNDLSDNFGALKKRKLLGRGLGSGKGKTSGRGGKGQTARSGVSLNGFEGGQMPVYRRLPQRGFKNFNRNNYFELHFAKLHSLIEKGILKSGDKIDSNFLIENKLMANKHDGISLILNDEISIPLHFFVSKVSKGAKEAIEKSGGTVTVE